MLDYEYFKINYELIAVDLIRQKELDTDLNSIPQIEFFGKLKNVNGLNADESQSMFILTIL